MPSNPEENTLGLWTCLLYTSDAADDLLCVDLGGRRIIKKKKDHVHKALQDDIDQKSKMQAVTKADV